MSVQLKLAVTLSDLSNADVTSLFKTDSSFQSVRKLSTTLQAIVGGNLKATVVVSTNEAALAATGTVTPATVLANDTVTINGVVFTAVTGAAGANQFDRSGTDAVTATNLAAAINASVSAGIVGYVTAEAASGVVTVSTTLRGSVFANGYIAMTSSDPATLALGGLSGGKLSGSTADATTKTYTF